MPIVHLRLSAICFSETQKARSSRMPRLIPPRATTRNSSSKSSVGSGRSKRSLRVTGEVALALTHCLLAGLVDRLQQVAQDRLATGLDIHGTDHAGDDRICLSVSLQCRSIG